MQLKISGCTDCPLCNINLKLEYYCAHPKFDEYPLLISNDINEVPVTPKKCPLNEYPIMISKKSWHTFENFWNREN